MNTHLIYVQYRMQSDVLCHENTKDTLGSKNPVVRLIKMSIYRQYNPSLVQHFKHLKVSSKMTL